MDKVNFPSTGILYGANTGAKADGVRASSPQPTGIVRAGEERVAGGIGSDKDLAAMKELSRNSAVTGSSAPAEKAEISQAARALTNTAGAVQNAVASSMVLSPTVAAATHYVSQVLYLDEGNLQPLDQRPADALRVCSVQTPTIPSELTGGVNAQQFNWLRRHGLISEEAIFQPVRLTKEQIDKADNLGIGRPPGMPDQIDWKGMKPREIIDWNIDRAIDILKRAEENQIDVVTFSELYPTPFFPSFAIRNKDLMKPFCVGPDLAADPSMKRLLDASKECGVTFSMGAAVAEGDKLYNANFWIQNGEVVNRYDKTNIPGARQDPQQDPSGFQRFTREFGVFEPSSSPVEPKVVEIRGHKVMLSSLICHDRRYDITRGTEEIAERKVLDQLESRSPQDAKIENMPAIVAIPFVTPRAIFPPDPKIDAQAYQDHYLGLQVVANNGALVLSSTRAGDDLGTELMGGSAVFAPTNGDSVTVENNRPAMVVKDISLEDKAFASRRAIKWQQNPYNPVPAMKTFQDYKPELFEKGIEK